MIFCTTFYDLLASFFLLIGGPKNNYAKWFEFHLVVCQKIRTPFVPSDVPWIRDFFVPLDELHFKLVIHERFYLKSVHSLANKTFKFFLTFLESALFICLFCVKSWTTKMLRKIHNNPLKLTLKNRVKTKVIFQIRGTHPPCEKMQKNVTTCKFFIFFHIFEFTISSLSFEKIVFCLTVKVIWSWSPEKRSLLLQANKIGKICVALESHWWCLHYWEDRNWVTFSHD